MAKKHNHKTHHSKSKLPTLGMKIPDVISYTVLIILFLVAVRFVQKVVGLNAVLGY